MSEPPAGPPRGGQPLGPQRPQGYESDAWRSPAQPNGQYEYGGGPGDGRPSSPAQPAASAQPAPSGGPSQPGGWSVPGQPNRSSFQPGPTPQGPQPGNGGTQQPNYGPAQQPNPGATPQGGYAPGGFNGPGAHGVGTGGHPPAGGGPAARPRPGGAGKLIALGALLLIVALVAVWAFNQRGGDADPDPTTRVTAPDAPATGGSDIHKLQVGQCMQFFEVPGATPAADGSIEVTHQVVDCGLAGQFKLLVASVTEGPATCPNDDYVQYYQEGMFGTSNQLTICLAPVLEPGQCYAPDGVKEYKIAPCSDPGSYFLVESELEGTDTSTCANPDESMPLPEPAPSRSYCLAPPQ